MMDESDDDFKELCASFFRRVKKNGTEEVFGEKKTRKISSNTQIRNKLKKAKQPATKKTFQDTVKKKPPSHSQAARTEQEGAIKSQGSEAALPVNGEEGMLTPAPEFPVLWEKAQSIQTESAPDSDSKAAASRLTPARPSPSRCHAAELVVQRMQQFKRVDPERLSHASEECTLKGALEEQGPENPSEEMAAGNGFELGLPATDSDTAVAFALQQEIGREGASTCDDGLEEKGLFFCQMCHKDLSTMTVTRRGQHVNRCLDEAERIRKSSVPQIPECPICGKPFLTSKSRASHLKQCAVRMEVGPQLLLQAVRLQAAQPREGSSPPFPSFNYTGGLKRKRATNKEPQKRQKVKPEPLSEDLMMAMALSRSEMEQSPAVPALRLESAFSEQIRLGAEKKSRKKRVLLSPPQLLVQDPETTGRQIEDRVAQLLAEEMELSTTPPLPASRILKKEELEKAGWYLQLPEGKQNFLWEGSALTGALAAESFYTADLIPLIVPQKPTEEPVLPLVLSEKSQPSVQRPPTFRSSPTVGPGWHRPLSASQREQQALQDLMDLAKEGLSASPLPNSSEELSGLDLLPSQLPLTGFVLSPKEKHPERSSLASHSLSLLVSDFGTMVNNPHLSDVQFQTDSGDLLYAHKFVLYARCPLLIQYVNREGFSAVEDGDPTQRVLLSDVRAEAVYAFLQYLYAADLDLPSHLAPDLHSLAIRFGVSDLAYLCEQLPAVTDLEHEQQEKEYENCESRAETFQELLRSVWGDEEEEAETLVKFEGHEEDREKVNEAEMEEIYEFAATQRKLLQEEKATDQDKDIDLLREDSPGAEPSQPGVEGNEKLEKAEQMESAWPEKDETPASLENSQHSLQLQDQCSDRTEKAETHEQEAPQETPGHRSSCSPSAGCQEGSKDGSLSLPITVHDYEQLPASTHDEFFELFQTTSSHNEHNDTVGESETETVCPPTPQQQSPGSRRPSQSQPHLRHTSNSSLSLSTPHSCSGVSKMASPRSPCPGKLAKRKRDSSYLTLLKEPGQQRSKRRSSTLKGKNKSIQISPKNSQPIDLTQSKSDRLSSRSQNPSSHVNKEDEVILLLDSDEELELEHTKAKSVSNDPPGRNVLDTSLKSSELFSVIDVDADQENSPSPRRREVRLQPEEGERQLESQVPVGSRGTPELFCDQESSPEEDNTTDNSWMVPATPLANRSRDCSSQTRITSLRMRTPVDKKAQHLPEASTECRAEMETTQKFSVIMPHMSPVTCPYPRRHRLSLLAPSPVSRGCPDFTRQYQKCSPQRLGLPNEIAVSEVVEVGDSEDEEEEATSHRANSSPLLDSDPPIPVDNCSWHAEPLSPIPIDHLNLERTGPLSTSSPRSRTQEALDNGGCYSPGLPDTTLNQGSFTAQGELPERSPRASTPGGSNRLSFLNPALWEDWDEEEEISPEAPFGAQTPHAQTQKRARPETPSANQKNLPPKVPITPMPRYSIMETPVLKKELDRFGVRPLPKRQMVLKLKEIFQYTHQTLESESEDEIPPSQVPPEVPSSQTLTTETDKPLSTRGHTQLKASLSPGTQRSKGPMKTKSPRHCVLPPSESITLPSRSPAGRPPLGSPGPDGDTQFLGSQESVATSVDSSDSSFSSQSSSCEFGAPLESAGEGEEVSASQAAIQTADMEETLRCYVRSKPALYQKVLMYQPLELSELQAELKRDGIHVATAKLLDILDTQCITFTTAASRKEKLKRRGQQRLGRKRKERN
ncbi:structure-specific endonuclease subunit SLX4 isoform X2 [Perognathus longimembris pacificus]|uniref:structure-specific endonuclease subunit SLX4 isoform X2 n=1 Tax=Perognathus longimembris pacificus TaxID=214514 RepID=UPI00201956EC|nr:structure-specific endonuclease subunit SLX4 isoform X2 [Perognathus longimembris pacificus]